MRFISLMVAQLRQQGYNDFMVPVGQYITTNNNGTKLFIEYTELWLNVDHIQSWECDRSWDHFQLDSVFTRVSCEDRDLLWQGTPQEFQKKLKEEVQEI